MELVLDEWMEDWLDRPDDQKPDLLLCNGKLVRQRINKRGFNIKKRSSVGYETLLKEIQRDDAETEIKILAEKYLPRNFQFFNSNIKKEKIFFLHIPKTAGSSLNQMLSEKFRKRKIRDHIESDRKNNYNSINTNKLDFISGHIRLYDLINRFALHNFLRVTILRNPYDQLISHINWVRFIGSDPNSNYFKAHSEPIQELSLRTKQYNFEKTKEVEKFVNELPQLGHRLFNNCQTRILINKKSPDIIPGESAKEAIQTLHYFDVIGTVEQIDPFIQKIYQKMDWGKPHKLPKTNELNNKYKLPKETDDLKKVLAPLFQEDQILYDHVNEQNKQ